MDVSRGVVVFISKEFFVIRGVVWKIRYSLCIYRCGVRYICVIRIGEILYIKIC